MCIRFCVKLEYSSTETVWMIQKAAAMGTGDWQFHHDNAPAHSFITPRAGFFDETSNHPGDSAPLQPRFCTLQLLAFPQTKNHLWKGRAFRPSVRFRKYDGTADGDWENCVRSQGAYIEGVWGVIVLCTVFLVSCIFSINVSIFRIALLNTFWTDLVQLNNRANLCHRPQNDKLAGHQSPSSNFPSWSQCRPCLPSSQPLLNFCDNYFLF